MRWTRPHYRNREGLNLTSPLSLPTPNLDTSSGVVWSPKKKKIHGLCTTSISLPLWTLSTLYDIAHLDIAQRFMVNGRKKIGCQKDKGNVLQKGMEKHDKNPVCYRGSDTNLIFSPSVLVTR